MVRFLLFMGLLAGTSLAGAEPRVNKVLPHLLDQKGRVALSPSLFERDAYQAHLRQHPAEISGLRFDVNWKVHRVGTGPDTGTNALTLRVEMRTSQHPAGTPLAIETPVSAPRWGDRWTALTLDGETYRREGDVVAWRATLWRGGQELTGIQSFLW